MIVKLYSKQRCPGCKFTKRKFDEFEIPFEEISLTDPDATDYVKSLGYSQAPVVVVEYGDDVTLSWSGYSPTKILELSKTLPG